MDEDIKRFVNEYVGRGGVGVPCSKMHEPTDQETRFTSTQSDDFSSSGTGITSYPVSPISASPGQRHSDKYLDYKSSTADDANFSFSETAHDVKSISGSGDCGQSMPEQLLFPMECSGSMYTPQSDVDPFMYFGLEKEDLIYLLSYHEEITPANLPLILKQIRNLKAKKTTATGQLKPYPEPQHTRSVISRMESDSLRRSWEEGIAPAEQSKTQLNQTSKPIVSCFSLQENDNTVLKSQASKPLKEPEDDGQSMPETQSPSEVQSSRSRFVLMSSKDDNRTKEQSKSQGLWSTSAEQPIQPETKMEQHSKPQQPTHALLEAGDQMVPGDPGPVSTPSALPELIIAPGTPNRPPSEELEVSEDVMHDCGAKLIRHTCSFCKKMSTYLTDSISHQNMSLHHQSCALLQQHAAVADAEPLTFSPAQNSQHCLQKTSSRSRSSSPSYHHGSKGQSSPRGRLEKYSSPRKTEQRRFPPRTEVKRRPAPKTSDEGRPAPWSSDQRGSPPWWSDHRRPPRSRCDERRSPRSWWDERLSPPWSKDERRPQPKRTHEKGPLPKQRMAVASSSTPYAEGRGLSSTTSADPRLQRSNVNPGSTREPPSKRLQDRIRKTETAPCIFWLPLTEEQVVQRRAAQAERMKRRKKRKEELKKLEKRRRERKKAGDVRTCSEKSHLETFCEMMAPALLAEIIKMELSNSKAKKGSTSREATCQGSMPQKSTPQESTSQGSTPQESTPQGSTSQGSTPQGSTPQGSTPQGSTPQESTPQESTSQGSTPQGSTPQGSTPQGSTPQGSTPLGSTPQGSTPQGSTPQGSTPQGSTPQGSTSQGSTPQGSTSQGSTSQGSTPQGSTPQGSTSQGSTPQGSTPQGSTSQGSTPQGSTPQGSTSQGSTPQGSTSQGSTSQGSTSQGSTPQGSKFQGSTSKASPAEPGLQDSETTLSEKTKPGKSSAPTMVRLEGIQSSVSRDDLITAVEHFGKTKSILLLRPKLQAIVCFENEDDANKLKTTKSFDVKGVAITIRK